MIEHVYRRTLLCKNLAEVYLATCDQEIVDATEGFGGRAIWTSSRHERASDRVAEVASKVAADIYVLVQGDEPLILPEMIEASLQPLLEDESVVCTNIAVPIRSEDEFIDPNTIKLVMDGNGRALYFSREPIPARYRLKFGGIPAYKQVCVIPFRRRFLLEYAQLTPTPLEIAESIDMLRAIEHGYQIHLVKMDKVVQSVDTPEDLVKVDALMSVDPLFESYRSQHRA